MLPHFPPYVSGVGWNDFLPHLALPGPEDMFTAEGQEYFFLEMLLEGVKEIYSPYQFRDVLMFCCGGVDP